MKEKILYVCDICGTEYSTKEEAEECEKNHVTKIEVIQCNHLSVKVCKDGFPTKITVQSADGRERKYRIYE